MKKKEKKMKGEEMQLNCARTKRRRKGKEGATMAQVWNFTAPLG